MTDQHDDPNEGNEDSDESSESIDRQDSDGDPRSGGDPRLDGSNGDFRTSFDPATDSASEELLEAVAALNDADPGDLPVLADYLDPEALDALFGPRPNGETRPSEGRVEFAFDGYEIAVHYSGTIAVRQPESVAGE